MPNAMGLDIIFAESQIFPNVKLQESPSLSTGGHTSERISTPKNVSFFFLKREGLMFKASTARSPVQLTAYTGFRGRSTSSRTVQPQASKDKYNPPPRPAIEDTMGTLSFAQPVTQTLPQRTVDPAMSGFPQPGSLCSPRATPGSRGPAASSSGGPAFRPRLAGSRWPVHSSLPPARLAARPHRVASVRNSPARPFPLVHTKRRWLLPRPPRCYPHAAAY